MQLQLRRPETRQHPTRHTVPRSALHDCATHPRTGKHLLGRCQARPPALVQCLVQLPAPVLGSEGNLTRMPGLGLPAPAPQEGRSLKPEQQTPTQGWQGDRARALACT